MNLNEMFYQSTVKLFDCNLIKNLLNVNFIYGRFVPRSTYIESSGTKKEVKENAFDRRSLCSH